MAKKFSASQYKSKLRQLERKQRQAINKVNHEINKYNRDVKKAVNNYNTSVKKYNLAVRQYNNDVKRNQRIIKNEFRKLNASLSEQNSYTISVKIMQKAYESVGEIYSEGQAVTPEQDNILNWIEQEQANSLVTVNCLEKNEDPDEIPADIDIGNRLAVISEDFNDRWKGAVFSLNPNNPDATRHFCTSTREIFTALIEMKAPDEKVFEYNPSCDKTPQGNATRREKIKYMLRHSGMDDSVILFVEEDIKNILELNQLLSGGTHGPAGKYSFKQLLQVKKRVEQGIIFLCELS